MFSKDRQRNINLLFICSNNLCCSYNLWIDGVFSPLGFSMLMCMVFITCVWMVSGTSTRIGREEKEASKTKFSARCTSILAEMFKFRWTHTHMHIKLGHSWYVTLSVPDAMFSLYPHCFRNKLEISLNVCGEGRRKSLRCFWEASNSMLSW